MMKNFWIFSLLLKAWLLKAQSLSFSLGSHVNLTCGYFPKPLFHVIWNVRTQNNECRLTFRDDVENNSCRDGLLITVENNSSFLHIPNFSKRDVGNYSGESVYSADRQTCDFSLSVTTPPKLSSWLEWIDGQLVAVCLAEGGNPAANISWRHAGNLTAEEKHFPISAQAYSTESRLTLPERYRLDKNTSIPVCVVSHLAWTAAKSLSPGHPGLPFYQVCIIHVAMVIVLVAGVSLLLYKYRNYLLSSCRRHIDPALTKSAQDVEEVEPYASYTQRVNSIYNS